MNSGLTVYYNYYYWIVILTNETTNIHYCPNAHQIFLLQQYHHLEQSHLEILI